MKDETPVFTCINRLGEVFEGRTPAEARAKKITAARRQLAEDAAANPGSVSALGSRLARLDAARKRERQRVEHLVLGRARPTRKITISKRKGGRGKAVEQPVTLEPGIEEAMQIREAWSHKIRGTPETWERASNTHDGALAQLHRNGTIDADQLEWTAQIANVYRSIEAVVGVKVASLEARVDQSRGGGNVAEGVMRVRLHLAYGYWRALLPVPKQLVLDMIVGDAVGYTVAAKRHRIHNRKAKRLLLGAINRWPRCVAHAFSAVDDETLQLVSWGVPVEPTWLNGPSQFRGTSMTPVALPPMEEFAEGVGVSPTLPDLPAIDPAFLDDAGRLKQWTDIAAIIRERMFGNDGAIPSPPQP